MLQLHYGVGMCQAAALLLVPDNTFNKLLLCSAHIQRMKPFEAL